MVGKSRMVEPVASFDESSREGAVSDDQRVLSGWTESTDLLGHCSRR